MVITELAVFEIARQGETEVRLIELASGVTLEELQEKTKADCKVAPALQAS
jgi:acyl CoA:acetate/3-ketoacid CoA transferase beta subunit